MIDQLRARISKVTEDMRECTHDLICHLDAIMGSTPTIGLVNRDTPVPTAPTLTNSINELEDATQLLREQMKRLWTEQEAKLGVTQARSIR